jgi:prepilin-type N-terminal cleavage/methylation domain-containing protein
MKPRLEHRPHQGLTLVELLIAASITGLISVAAAAVLSTCLQAHAYAAGKSALFREGLIAMERMTQGVRISTFLLIPNNRRPARNILAFSGAVNDDNDSYFNDLLYPRIDEDTGADMNADGAPGIKGVDDNGGGLVDNGAGPEDDDEDGLRNEDKLDGRDNDLDGNIDEDVGSDMNKDGKPGIAKMDDNADGIVDNGGGLEDDDEDGLKNEDPLNPILYTYDGATRTLRETPPGGTATTLSSHVTDFTVTYEPPDTSHDPRISISLTLTSDTGESVRFFEYAYPRNVKQKTGKRCR